MDRSALLARFVAWLAVHERDEHLRSRYYRHVDAYLAYAAANGGPSSTVRVRWEATVPHTATATACARRALDRFEEHQSILARTEIPGPTGAATPIPARIGRPPRSRH